MLKSRRIFTAEFKREALQLMQREGLSLNTLRGKSIRCLRLESMGSRCTPMP